MDTAHSRLKEARRQAGYRSAKAGAERLAQPYPTYAAHENGSRAYDRNDATRYAKAFGVRPEWLLFGELGAEPITQTQDPQSPLAPIVKAITDALDGLTEEEQRMIAIVVKRQRDLFRPEES